ncbi:hypothetical protein ACUXV3_10110 [Roseobacteraceae bacterium NS-SX3]
MPLEILLILVIGGISAIAVLLHATGRSAPVQLDAASARRAWLRHAPDDTVHDVTLAASGHAALVQASSGPGVVWSFGADTVARHLRDTKIRPAPAGLRLSFHDFGTPGVTLTLTEDERARWRQLMTAA